MIEDYKNTHFGECLPACNNLTGFVKIIDACMPAYRVEKGMNIHCLPTTTSISKLTALKIVSLVSSLLS